MKRVSLALTLACALLTAGPYAARPSLLKTRTFDPDEFQHLHAAWSYQQGQLPFRDFFEHHMPGIYYLLRPVLAAYDVSGSSDAAIDAVFAARLMMLACALLIAIFTFLLGRKYGGTRVALIGTALLSTNIVFVSRTLEIRPDVPALACWVASQLSLFAALRAGIDDGRFRRVLFASSGVLFGGTLLFTQKAVLAGPGFAAFSMLYVAPPSMRSRANRVVDLTVFAAAAMVPLGAMAMHFWSDGALAALVAGVWTNNLGWIQEIAPSTTLRWMALRDPFFCALAIAGLFLASAAMVADWRNAAAAALLLPTLSLFAGMAMMPAPFPQYLLLILPASAIYGADFLVHGVQRAAAGNGDERSRAAALNIGTFAFGIVAFTGLAFAKPFFRHAVIYPALAFGALAITAVLVRRRRAELAVTVLLTSMSIYSLQQLTWMAGLSNADAIATMRFIHDSTTPESRVMDGFSGLGWFRPHAAFHWFTAPGVRARLTAADKFEMAAMVEGCGPRPQVVILDEHLRQVSADVAPLVARHFNPTPYQLLWMRDPARDSCGALAADKSAKAR